MFISKTNYHDGLVVILLCTYNGDRFLIDQLSSIEAQDYKNWIVIVSDDGSNDNTLPILNHYKLKWPDGKLQIRNGPQNGFCTNFLTLACDKEIKGDFYAFCDQDDIWKDSKLSFAVKSIINCNISINTPILYCGRTFYLTENELDITLSPLHSSFKSFNNAIIQSIAGANTMVFNHSAKIILEKFGVQDVPSHDWWLYLIITGVEGHIIYDSSPQVYYRQHSNSLVGGNVKFFDKLKRLLMIFNRRLYNWRLKNTSALIININYLSERNKIITKLLYTFHNNGVLIRFLIIIKYKIFRQSKFQTFLLFLFIFFNII